MTGSKWSETGGNRVAGCWKAGHARVLNLFYDVETDRRVVMASYRISAKTDDWKHFELVSAAKPSASLILCSWVESSRVTAHSRTLAPSGECDNTAKFSASATAKWKMRCTSSVHEIVWTASSLMYRVIAVQYLTRCGNDTVSLIMF